MNNHVVVWDGFAVIGVQIVVIAGVLIALALLISYVIHKLRCNHEAKLYKPHKLSKDTHVELRKFADYLADSKLLNRVEYITKEDDTEDVNVFSYEGYEVLSKYEKHIQQELENCKSIKVSKKEYEEMKAKLSAIDSENS